MNIIDEMYDLRDEELLKLPKFKASLEKLLNKPFYDNILSVERVSLEALPQFIEKAINEGNAVLIQREYCGYMVILWRD